MSGVTSGAGDRESQERFDAEWDSGEADAELGRGADGDFGNEGSESGVEEWVLGVDAVADGVGDRGGSEERLSLPGGSGFAECEEHFAAEVGGVPDFEEAGAEVGEFVGGGRFEEGGFDEFFQSFA